jgi:hypothetical protein
MIEIDLTSSLCTFSILLNLNYVIYLKIEDFGPPPPILELLAPLSVSNFELFDCFVENEPDLSSSILELLNFSN